MKDPWVTLDGGGLTVHYAKADGTEVSFPISPDAALGLVAELTGKLQELRTSPELQAKVGSAIALKLFKWFS
jgi:hypothetical protein